MASRTGAFFLVLTTISLSFVVRGGEGDTRSGVEKSGEEFRNAIRTTRPLSGSEERSCLKVPPDFKVTLVASEPDISKPMNMAFDWKGRLWVTCSTEYPFPAESGKGSDTIKILEDRDGDGTADKITTFADDLNIPMGLYPYADGVVCFSIPNILFLRDTNGDGKADKRQILYGPFDTSRDTHGMCNGFTRGFDGWLYACHGFNNQSSVSGRDGNQVTMHSGNVFRVRMDGSRIEHFTHGQVNPFGLAIDPAGDLFSADCHTKPISLLLRGGYYESFGKPHDGLGFVPKVMDHLHGSTAIGGIALNSGNGFPESFRGDSFGGNVMTSRVNRNSIRREGSTIIAKQESDFLVSEDPWFRPVDLQFGPDGSLYVADFYNRIIGHYEVPLSHEGRDRHRGRIWRVSYVGSGSGEEHQIAVARSIQDCIDSLDADNFTLNQLCLNRLVDHFGSDASMPLRNELAKSPRPQKLVHLLWALSRLDGLDADHLMMSGAHPSALVRSHACQILGSKDWDIDLACTQLCSALADSDGHVRRMAALASTRYRSPLLANALLDALSLAPERDVHLVHALKLALREQLRDESIFANCASQNDALINSVLLDLSSGIKTAQAARFVASRIDELDPDTHGDLSKHIEFCCRYLSGEQIDSFVRQCKLLLPNTLENQERRLRSIHVGFLQRGEKTPQAVKDWAIQLSREYLRQDLSHRETRSLPTAIHWQSISYLESGKKPSPWSVSLKRNSADGRKATPLYSSFPAGESRTGIYQSAPFVLPADFHFFMAGHDGPPKGAAQDQNLVRLRDCESNVILHHWKPPRNDQARRYQLNSIEHVGKRVQIEIVDGDAGRAYAWVAAGRFSLEALNPLTQNDFFRRSLSLVKDLRLTRLRPTLMQQYGFQNLDTKEAMDLASTLATLQPSSVALAAAESIDWCFRNESLRDRLFQILDDSDEEFAVQTLSEALKNASLQQQKTVAQNLAVDAIGTRILLRLANQGQISRSVFRDEIVMETASRVATKDQLAAFDEMAKEASDADGRLASKTQDIKDDFLRNGGDRLVGNRSFKTRCAVCHKLGGEGADVGPNLDGIGLRGLDRLLEDILIPGRNVDKAFRASVVVTTSGQVHSGIIKRVVGKQTVLVDSKGAEVVLANEDIEQTKTLSSSPMPENLHESIPRQEFLGLIAFLLSLRE